MNVASAVSFVWDTKPDFPSSTTFVPRIFEARDWADLFGNFEDPVDELVKEFYSNARYTGVELKC